MIRKEYDPANLFPPSDRNDAEAICEAIGRPLIRILPPKSFEQLAIQTVHRIRRDLILNRVMLVNQIRGLLAGHWVVIPEASPACGEIPG